MIAERGLPEVVPVLERDGLVAGCPVASRVPYELLIAPARSEPEGLRSDLLGPALCLLAELVRRLQRVRGETLVPLNAWLHDGPHWHLELFPRTRGSPVSSSGQASTSTRSRRIRPQQSLR